MHFSGSSMIKVLDRYLLKYFLVALLLVAFGIGLLILVINMIEELQRFVDNNVPMKDIIIYYIYFAGWILKSFLPVFVLLAALISIGILARRNEILAMKASGISLYRIAAPFLVFSFLLSVAHIYYNEVIFANANKKRVEMSEYTIKKRPAREKNSVRNIYRQVNKNFFYTIASYNASTMEGRDIRLYRSDQDRLIELITAARIDYGSKGWVLHDGIKRIFEDSTETFDEFDSMTVSYIKEKPSDFEVPLGQPEDMSYSELSHYIKMMKRTGGPYQREMVDLRLKISYPFASFIVILICVPIASNPKRGGIAISVAVGTGIALLYFVCFKITQSFGYNERLTPDVAAWMINIIFLVAGLLIMWKTRK